MANASRWVAKPCHHQWPPPAFQRSRSPIRDHGARHRSPRANLRTPARGRVLAGRQAFDLAATTLFDLIVLDIGLPEIDGFGMCQQLRRDGNFAPVLMLTARDQPDHLNSGELLARVEVLLRRAVWARAAPDRAFPEDAWGAWPESVPLPTRPSTMNAVLAARLSSFDSSVLRPFSAPRDLAIEKRHASGRTTLSGISICVLADA